MSKVGKQLKFLNKISFNTRQTQILLDPSKYSGIKLTFQYQIHNGHMGAKKFWHEYLPTLKFYNPNMNIDVIRIKNENTKDVSVPCSLEIISKDGQVIENIDMRNKRDNEIMDEFLSKVEYSQVPEGELVKL